MTALRWFLSYLLPMLIISSIAAAYFFRTQISADWYRTLSWPVTQINAVMQQQKIQLNIVEPGFASTTVKDKTLATLNTNRKQTTKTDKPHDETIVKNNEIQPLMHPIEPSTKIKDDSATPLMHPIIQEIPKMPILPKQPVIVAPQIVPQYTKPTDKLALAPQTQQRIIPYPQPGMSPPVMRSPFPQNSLPNYNFVPRPAPKPPTVFKLNKKQKKLLYQARKAYWTKDFKKAKKQYLILTKQLPDNPDIQGELGNLFYFERKLEPAIKHYTLAAKLLIKHRHFWKLPRIMQIVSRFNPSKANEVMQLFRNRHSTTTNKTNTGKKGK